jgi:hypothetical protein
MAGGRVRGLAAGGLPRLLIDTPNSSGRRDAGNIRSISRVLDAWELSTRTAPRNRRRVRTDPHQEPYDDCRRDNGDSSLHVATCIEELQRAIRADPETARLAAIRSSPG